MVQSAGASRFGWTNGGEIWHHIDAGEAGRQGFLQERGIRGKPSRTAVSRTPASGCSMNTEAFGGAARRPLRQRRRWPCVHAARWLPAGWLVAAALACLPEAAALHPTYHYDVVAADGMSTSDGFTLVAIESEVSVNEVGRVAFTARIGDGDQLVVGRHAADLRNISRAPAGRNFSYPQINNQDWVITRELLSGNSAIRRWDARNPGAGHLVASTTLSAFTQVSNPVLANFAERNPAEPFVAYLGRPYDLTFSLFANYSGRRDEFETVSPLTGTTLQRFRSMCAADGDIRTVLAQFTDDQGLTRLAAWDSSDPLLWNGASIAGEGPLSGGTWLELGNAPGLSDSGEYVAFAARHRFLGPGLFVARGNPRFRDGVRIIPILGLTTILGYDDTHRPVGFAAIDLMHRTAILHERRGPGTGRAFDRLTIVFAATPERSGRSNPALPGAIPFHFAAEPGLWMVRVDLHPFLEDPTRLGWNARSPLPVVQVGDRLPDGSIVADFATYDPLARAQVNFRNEPYDPDWTGRYGDSRYGNSRWGDHIIAFAAQTDHGMRVVRATRTDADVDGLMDHWELEGVDADGDGFTDLDLPALGATPDYKDVFLEVDWCADRRTGGQAPWSNVFPPYTAQGMAEMFRTAPVDNPNGRRGIRLHVDAGDGGYFADAVGAPPSPFGYMSFIPHSVNMPRNRPDLLDGGEEVFPAGHPERRMELVYFGVPYNFTIPGLEMEALHNLKNRFFGDGDAWARDYVFKYAVLADALILIQQPYQRAYMGAVVAATSNRVTVAGMLPNGPNLDDAVGREDCILLVGGRGAGQIRRIDAAAGNLLTLRDSWDIIPDATSTFVLLGTSTSGFAEGSWFDGPNHHSRSGNDFLIAMTMCGVNDGGWLADYATFWTTMAHELGHCLGLRHGGVNHDQTNPDYESIMNYVYLQPAPTLFDYADDLDLVFDDWDYLRHDTSQSGLHFDNSYNGFFTMVGPAIPVVPTNNPHSDFVNSIPVDESDPPSLETNQFVITPPLEEEVYVEPDKIDFVPDLERPRVAVLQPLEGTHFNAGSTVNVLIRATDNVGISAVFAVMDRNGNGIIEDAAAERAACAAAGPNLYSTSFGPVQGPFTARGVLGIAFDLAGNTGGALAPITAGDPAGAGLILHQSNGSFPAQPTGSVRQTHTVGPITVPGSGNLTFTVSASPPARSTTPHPADRDAAVERIVFAGVTQNVVAAFTPPTNNPAVSTTYWQAPSAGPLYVTVQGPVLYDATGHTKAHAAQSFALVVTFQAVDLTPPLVHWIEPQEGDFAEVGGSLAVRVGVTDDYGVAGVTLGFDLNGDGALTGAMESVTAAALGGSIYGADFHALSGAGGVRTLWAEAVDTAGLRTLLSGTVEVRVPDTQAPQVVIRSPPSGWPVAQGTSLVVEVQASDDMEMAAVQVSFDVNGNGTITGAAETVQAAWSGVNTYTASFAGITGSNGARNVHALARDTSGNTAQASRPVTVGGVQPVTNTLYSNTGVIPAQPSMWSGGSQQTVEFDPIPVPGSGPITFVVTDNPSERSRGTNIQRADSYVRNITFNGTNYNLSGSLSCNAWSNPVSVCTTTFNALQGGTLDFSLLGPGSWNIWGEFSGHLETHYTIEIRQTAQDYTRPQITWVSPLEGDGLAAGLALTARVRVTDDQQVASVVVLFDVDGDRDTDDFGEERSAVDTGGGLYETTFGVWSGEPGPRTLRVLATDTSFNQRDGSITLGLGGVGEGETNLYSDARTIPAQPDQWSGGSRQVLPYGPIHVPGQGRMTFRVESTPSIRKLGTNLQREDPKVLNLRFNGSLVTLNPVCNAWNAEPAVCVSTWDSPGPGELRFEVLGGGTWNTWGEFSGHYAQSIRVDLDFLPGPTVTSVVPARGSTTGGEPVSVRGHGFAANAMVLFGEVPGTEAVWQSAEEVRCQTPPGIVGPVMVRVLNPDPEGQPWNYGVPYGLFGSLTNGFLYEEPPPAPPSGGAPGERCLGTFKGYFAAVGLEEPQREETHPMVIPAAGRLRFETFAFVPILNPIPGPFGNPDDLSWHNESTAVRYLVGGNAAGYWTDVQSTDLSYPYGPVRCNATWVAPAAAVGSGQFTIRGPARWNAFWREFGDFVMISAPAQHWSLAVWFAAQPVLTSITPTSDTTGGGGWITLRGSNFFEGLTVQFGGAYATQVTVVDQGTAICRAPPNLAGQHAVTLRLLGMTASLPTAFTVNPFVIQQMVFTPGHAPPSLRAPTSGGKLYQLERCLDLKTPQVWTAAGPLVPGDNTLRTFTDPSPPSRFYLFYRLTERPAP